MGVARSTIYLWAENHPEFSNIRAVFISMPDLEEELLSFAKSLHDDKTDSAPYQVGIVQSPRGKEDLEAARTRAPLTQNTSR